MKTILIMAGGTGGHVYPALSVAKSLMNHGVGIVWLGTRSGLESSV
ncbi:MAG: glycosyltransferase, partial [Methylococcales bacterium]|nr:glycosyltransferase [Methylococcales bacterium]